MEPLPTPESNPSRRRTIRLAILGGAVVAIGGIGATALPYLQESVTPDKPTTIHHEPTPPHAEFSVQPTWQQAFNHQSDGELDPVVWSYNVDPAVPTYNAEEQAYTGQRRNVRIEKDALVIEAHREAYAYPNDPSGHAYDITSGRIDTHNSFSFEYGKIEATMKLPSGAGTWPAFWLLSANQPYTSILHPSAADWAQKRFYMHDGELDIMEAYGTNPGVVEATAYTYNQTVSAERAVPDMSNTFHTYGLEVTPTKVTWTIDGSAYYSFQKPSDNPDAWPFGHGNRFYVILNLAMGWYRWRCG
ncbi:MAG: glycoside hydrolase family 16 protein [Candidatus Saccharimonadales bacterium]